MSSPQRPLTGVVVRLDTMVLGEVAPLSRHQHQHHPLPSLPNDTNSTMKAYVYSLIKDEGMELKLSLLLGAAAWPWPVQQVHLFPQALAPALVGTHVAVPLDVQALRKGEVESNVS